LLSDFLSKQYTKVSNIFRKQYSMNQNRFPFTNHNLIYRLLCLFIFQSLNSQAQKTHDYTTNLQKEIPLQYYSPKNVEDNLKPAIDLLHSWG
jgi:muramoyltetrapeptide carboxypeptidase